MKGMNRALGMLMAGRSSRTKLTEEMRDALGQWGGAPWTFLTGVWPLPRHVREKGSREPRPIFWTNDTYNNETRPFPDFKYLRYAVIEPAFGSEAEPGIYDVKAREPIKCWDKPRQVLATTGILAGITWEVLFRESIQWLIAKNKKPEAEDLVVEKMRFAYERLPQWLQDHLPVRPIPAGRFKCRAMGSVAKAVGRNFGRSESKGGTADVFIDEAPMLTGLRSAVEAASAMARRILMVGTPPEDGQADPESVLYYRELLEGRAAGELTHTLVGSPDEDDDAASDAEDIDELVGVVAH